jgi:hypothetical protein
LWDNVLVVVVVVVVVVVNNDVDNKKNAQSRSQWEVEFDDVK